MDCPRMGSVWLVDWCTRRPTRKLWCFYPNWSSDLVSPVFGIFHLLLLAAKYHWTRSVFEAKGPILFWIYLWTTEFEPCGSNLDQGKDITSPGLHYTGCHHWKTWKVCVTQSVTQSKHNQHALMINKADRKKSVTIQISKKSIIQSVKGICCIMVYNKLTPYPAD